jgi:hypothetical protein
LENSNDLGVTDFTKNNTKLPAISNKPNIAPAIGFVRDNIFNNKNTTVPITRVKINVDTNFLTPYTMAPNPNHLFMSFAIALFSSFSPSSASF